MTAPFVSWLLLLLAMIGAGWTITALIAGRYLGWGNVAWFTIGWLTSELALFHITVSALVAAALAALGALSAWPGQLGMGVMVLCWIGLVIVHRRASPTPQILERSLRQALGGDYRARIPAARRSLLREAVGWQELARPFALRQGAVEWQQDIPYASGHERYRLDVYRPRETVEAAPVLLQIHGGGWTIGSKREQALPLVYYLASLGWVVVAANYRLSPAARFPAHLIDCKRALAWIRRNIVQYGGDPSFVAVTGGSAGAHLAALMALTPNRADLQPDFADIDTTLAACVPFYGIYDFRDPQGLRRDGGAMTRWLARTVMPGPPERYPELWDLASPLEQARTGAPPFFVLHGTHDSLAKVEEARLFVSRLRGISHNPVAYAELPGAQHAWDLFRSLRALHSIHAVAFFLEWARSAQREAASS